MEGGGGWEDGDSWEQVLGILFTFTGGGTFAHPLSVLRDIFLTFSV